MVFLAKLYKILIICVVKNKHIFKQWNCFTKTFWRPCFMQTWGAALYFKVQHFKAKSQVKTSSLISNHCQFEPYTIKDFMGSFSWKHSHLEKIRWNTNRIKLEKKWRQLVQLWSSILVHLKWKPMSMSFELPRLIIRYIPGSNPRTDLLGTKYWYNSSRYWVSLKNTWSLMKSLKWKAL